MKKEKLNDWWDLNKYDIIALTILLIKIAGIFLIVSIIYNLIMELCQ